MENQDNDELRHVTSLDLLAERSRQMKRNAMLPTPMVDVDNVMAEILTPEAVRAGDTFSFPEGTRLRIDEMVDSDGKHWHPLFLSREEAKKGRAANIVMPLPIREIVRMSIENPDVEGIVINPFGLALPVPKEILEILWRSMEEGVPFL